mmetsp:Transcript_8945/g.21229  ORF Transcript_8945/g.21229 Transcript_8945/m.21229 type:complete len:103 (+) Transcript_8945:538-846(+)
MRRDFCFATFLASDTERRRPVGGLGLGSSLSPESCLAARFGAATVTVSADFSDIWLDVRRGLGADSPSVVACDLMELWVDMRRVLGMLLTLLSPQGNAPLEA